MSNYSSSASSKMSYLDIIAKAKAKISIISVKNVENTSPAINNNAAYPLFTPDKKKDIDDKHLCDSLLNVRKVSPSGPQRGKTVAVVKAAGALKIPGLVPVTWKLSLPNMRHKPDVAMFSKLQLSGLYAYSDPVKDLYRSNGTKLGLLNRLVQKLIPDCRNDTVFFKGIVFYDRHEFEKEFNSDSVVLKKLNPHAASGMPYALFPDNDGSIPGVTGVTKLPIAYHTTGDSKTYLLSEPIPIMEHAIHWAHKMFVKIVDEATSAEELISNMKVFFLEHPELNTFILKRKDEKMNRADFYEKVRPYGAQPLPTRLLSMWAVKPMEDNIVSFVENLDSISAYHYSPFYGGSKHIIDYFVHHYQKRVFCGLAYGDDQLWQIKLNNGKTVMLAPDVSAMDMSTSNTCILDIIRFISNNPVKFPKNNFFALIMSLTLAFKHDIHLGGPYIVSKLHSLISGIPGTTIINIFNSARIQTIVEEIFSNEPVVSQENFFSILGKALETVKSRLGYIFKNYESLSFDVAQDGKSVTTFDKYISKYSSTMIYTDINKIQLVGIPLPFLSQVIVPFVYSGETRLISAPADIFKFGASLVLPDSKSLKGTIAATRTLERIAGVYVSGGWIDSQFCEFLQNQYKSIVQGAIASQFSFCDIPSVGEYDLLDILTYMKRPELPSREFMFDFNTLDKDTFSKKYSNCDNKVFNHDPIKDITPVRKSNDNVDTFDSTDYNTLEQQLVFEIDKIMKPEKMNVCTANTIVKDKAKETRLNLIRERKSAEIESVHLMIRSKKLKGKFLSSIDRAYDSQLDLFDRASLMDNFYKEMDETISDEGGEADELYTSLRDSQSSFYRSWDSYEEDDGSAEGNIKSREEMEKEELDYLNSELGKFELSN